MFSKNSEVLPYYDQEKLNELYYKLKNYKYLRNKYENDNEFNKQLLHITKCFMGAFYL